MNAKIVETLRGINETINELINELATTEVAQPVKAEKPVKEEKPAREKKSNVVPMTRKEKEAKEEIPEELTEESLNALSYNNLKKLAKDMNISAVGSRAELTERLLSGEVPSDTPAETEEVEEVVEEKPKAKKFGKKVEPVEEVEEEEAVEEDPIEAGVNLAVADLSDEEIMDILTDVGIKARGKRQALISAVVKAVREGKIDLADDEESAEVKENEESDESLLDLGENVTPERREAILNFIQEIDESFENGTITRKEMADWLNSYLGSKEYSSKKIDDLQVKKDYIATICANLIDDEGNIVDEPSVVYMVNEVPFCCGGALEYNEDKEEYHCASCGSDYSAE